jgi:hypothetical protein
MKKVIRLTESDLMRIVKRVMTESGGVAMITPEKIKNVNYNSIITPAFDLIDTTIKDTLGVPGMLKKLVKTYVSKVENNSNKIIGQIKNKDAKSSSQLYLSLLTQTITESLNDLGTVYKFAIRKYYSRAQLKSLLMKEQSMDYIIKTYDNLLVWPLEDYDVSKKFYDYLDSWISDTQDALRDRRDGYVNQIIELVLNGIYGSGK